MLRCPWSEKEEIYIRYHDEEWGVPVHDDVKHFEFLVLESAQAGLSWLTVLKKRENYRAAYGGFDPLNVSRFGEREKDMLLRNSGLIRNIKKIESSINNAARFLEVCSELGSFDRYIWSFTDFKPIVNSWETLSEIPPKTALSDAISSDLKKRGFKFLGSTIIYSHLQAVGIVNDHIRQCFRYGEIIDSYGNMRLHAGK